MKLFKGKLSKSSQDIQTSNEFEMYDSQQRSISNASSGRTSNDGVAALDETTQMALLKTFENFYEQESEAMITALEESREEIKNSMLDLFYEQEQFKEELVRASEGKYTYKRKKENMIPLAEYLRRKKGFSRNNNSGTPNKSAINQSEKEAVDKYIRKKERQKQAEANRSNRQTNEKELEAETQKILTKLNDMDLNKEKERQRQMEKLQAKLKTKPQQKDDKQIANEIMDSYQESKMAFERDKKLQYEKFQARMSARRGDLRDPATQTIVNETKSKYSVSNSKFPQIDI